MARIRISLQQDHISSWVCASVLLSHSSQIVLKTSWNIWCHLRNQCSNLCPVIDWGFTIERLSSIARQTSATDFLSFLMTPRSKSVTNRKDAYQPATSHFSLFVAFPLIPTPRMFENGSFPQCFGPHTTYHRICDEVLGSSAFTASQSVSASAYSTEAESDHNTSRIQIHQI